MSPDRQEIEEVEEPTTRTSSPRRVAIVFWVIAALMFLVASGFAGFEYSGVLRVEAGSARPWADRLDWVWGDWGFKLWRIAPGLAEMRMMAAIIAGLLFILPAWGLKKGFRWSVWVGLSTTAVCLAINSAVLGADLWEIIGWMKNTSGMAFGKGEPQWADKPMLGPIVMLVMEVLMLAAMRMLTRLRTDVLR